MVFHWSLNDSKSPQISRTLLSILTILSNAVIWIVSTCPPTSKSSRPFNNPLVIVPKVPITIDTIITFMFHCCCCCCCCCCCYFCTLVYLITLSFITYFASVFANECRISIWERKIFLVFWVPRFGFIVYWHISLRGSFTAKTVLPEVQYWYYLIHSSEDKGVHTFSKGICL